jgi:hypothetical protein
MATGETFMRIHWQRQLANRAKISVDKKTEQKVKTEIAELQKMDSALWNDDSLEDAFVEQKSKEYNSHIQELINSIY